MTYSRLSDKGFKNALGSLIKQTTSRDQTALNILLNCVEQTFKGNKNPLTELHQALHDNPDAFPKGFSRALKFQFTDPFSNSQTSWVTMKFNKDKKQVISIAGWGMRNCRLKFSDNKVMIGETEVTHLRDLMPPEIEKDEKPINPLMVIEKAVERLQKASRFEEGLDDKDRIDLNHELNKIIRRYSEIAAKRIGELERAKMVKATSPTLKGKRRSARKVPKATILPVVETVSDDEQESQTA